ncbi:glycosyltransferase family 4 protein [Candidatus Uhrbacteria bacterium]|nr:glycosyltransferase family 4 protein [Candidatus Uhrbacteria bacterium]
MNILMVVGQFYPIIGGAERQCLKLSKALQARGHQVKVLTVWNPRNVSGHESVEGITVERVWYPIVNVFGYRVGLGFLAPFFMCWRAYRIMREYDVAHVHQCLWPAFSAAVAARARRVPVVCKLGNSGERFDLEILRRTHSYGRFAVWYVKRAITKFVWTSEAVRDDLMREGIKENKMVYIPNGVELVDVRRTVSQDSGGSSSITRFIFTGTFTLKKNLLALLKAANGLPHSYRAKMKLLLLGDGPDRATLTDAVKQYKLEDIVDIQGPVDGVGAYLQKSDAFVLPSATEGLSNSALEAMAYGLPVILSNRGGNAELVKDNGILIEPDQVESLRDALRYMIDHSQERMRMAQRSLQIVEERYALGKVVEKYEELYRSLKH